MIKGEKIKRKQNNNQKKLKRKQKIHRNTRNGKEG